MIAEKIDEKRYYYYYCVGNFHVERSQSHLLIIILIIITRYFKLKFLISELFYKNEFSYVFYFSTY